MTTPDEETAIFVQRLRQQIDALSQEQTEALKRAVFMGMTASEAKQYDARRIKITMLTKQLAEIKQAQSS